MILTVTLNTSIEKFYLLDRLQSCTVMRAKRVNNTSGGKGMSVSQGEVCRFLEDFRQELPSATVVTIPGAYRKEHRQTYTPR